MSPLLKKNDMSKDLRKYCITSGLLALVVMLFVYLCHGNTLLFGERTVLRMDLYHQYGPLYAELYDRITEGYSLVYSWTSGAGSSFLGNLFNYCCSPFALILLFVGHKNMPEAIALMILLKAVTSSVSFTYYINKTNRCVNRLSIPFGLMYAFCSYFVAYSWNIMWLDAMAIFPLVMLGIENIIQKKKPALYIFAMTYTMITNYYMAYMVCILSVIYFIYYYFGRYEFSAKLSNKLKAQKEEAEISQENTVENVEKITVVNENTTENELSQNTENEFSQFDASATEAEAEQSQTAVNKKVKKRKKRDFRNNRFFVTGCTFAFSSFLCFMLSAFALLPVYFCLQSSSATSEAFPDSLKTYFNIFDFIANHLPAVATTIRSSGDIVLPNVYCGMLTVILLPLYFLNSKIKGSQKVAAACILGLFYISFSINYLNFMWHGFHFPNDLPYRFSFAYSFILLTLAYKAIINIEDFKNKTFITVGMGAFAFAVLLDKFGSKNVETFTVVLTIVLTVIYVVILGLFNSKRYLRKSVVSLLTFAVIVELCVANTANYTMAQPKDAYTSDYDNYQSISQTVEEDETELFYRTELSKLRTRMDPSWYGYNGVSAFSSMAYEHVAKIMEKLGMFGNNINSYTYYPQTPIFNSMFSIKYLYDNSSDLLNEGQYYSFITENDDFSAYEYKYYLPLAFSVDAAVADWDMSSGNPFDVQNSFIYSATGIEDVLEPAEVTEISTSNIDYVNPESVNGSVAFSVNKTSSGSEGKITLYIDVNEDGHYYIYSGSTRLSNVAVNADDFSYSYASSAIQPFTVDVGYQTAGARISVELTLDQANDSASVSFCAAKLNLEKFEEAYDIIKSNGTINLTSFDETSMEGTIKVNNDNAFLYTSIPYDTSWEVIVDGVALEYYNEETDASSDGKIIAVGDALIGFELSEGEHTVSFKYNAKGLSEGIMLTVAGVIILLLALLYKFYFSEKLRAKGVKLDFIPEPDNFNY